MQNILCNTRYCIVQKLSDEQSVNVICRFGRLRTNTTQQETERPYEHWQSYQLPMDAINIAQGY